MTLSGDLKALEYSTFFGGAQGYDSGNTQHYIGSGIGVLAGWTNSVDFPVTEGAYSTSLNGSSDIFVAKYDLGIGGIVTDLTMDDTSLLTKSQVSFQVAFTNRRHGVFGPGDEYVPKLRVMLYNGKIGRNLSHLLPPLPALAPGQNFSTGPILFTVPATKYPFLQAILDAPLRLQSRVMTNGELDRSSFDHVAFKVTERDVAGDCLVNQTDENADSDFSDGNLGGSGGNEGFFSFHNPNLGADMMATALVLPDPIGNDGVVTAVEYSAADFEGYTGIEHATVGLYRDDGFGKPNLSLPIVEDTSVDVPDFSASGGDHWNPLTIDPPGSVSPSETVWFVFRFGEARGDRLGVDNPLGGASGSGNVAYWKTWRSTGGGLNWEPHPGHLLVRLHVNDLPDLEPPN